MFYETLFLSVSLQDIPNIKQSPGSAPNKLLSALTSGLTESGSSTAQQNQFQISTSNLNGHLTASLASMNGHGHNHSLENTNSNSNANSLTAVSVKPEPEDALPCIRSPPASVAQVAASTANSGRHKSPPKALPLPASSSAGGNGSGTPLPPKKKRKLSIKGSSDMLTPSSLKGHSFSCSDDLEDDLKLSADDCCITGVISTPLSLIKPLEEGEDMVTTPSPPLSASAPKNDPPSSSSFSSSSSSHPPAASSSSFQNAGTGRAANYSLKQDLDDFTKVMAQVTEEEIAKERRKSHSSTQLLQNDPYRASQPLNITTPAHLVSPPPYHTTATPARQQQPMASQPPGHYFSTSHPPQHNPIVPMSRHLSPEGSSYSIQSYHNPTAAHQYTQLPHMLPQVDPTSATNPTTFPPPPPTMSQQQLLQRRSVEHIQKHPQLQHLSAISPQVQPPQPIVLSPTVHTPISTQHMPLFPDPTSHSSTTPTGNLNLSQTPTTPLEHFTSFTSQHLPRMDNPPLNSPTHPPLPFHSGVGSIPSAYPYGQKIAADHTQTVVGSPTVTTAGMSWGSHGTLKETLLQVNSHLEPIVGQKRPNRDAIGLGFPPAKISHTSTVIHNAAPNPNFQQQQYHPSSNYTGVNFSLPNTVAYQGHPTTFPYAPI